jgi:hypothetical protein
MRAHILVSALILLTTSCAAPPPVSKPPIVTAPAPVVKPAPLPTRPVIQQPAGHWTDWTIAAGAWVYRRDERGSIALYGTPGADALVTLRCDKARARLFLSRASDVGGTMTVRTSSTSKALSVQPTGGKPAYAASEIGAGDPILDAMAFSRGRIALELNGAQNIAIPVWSEIGRVVEDCRG